MPSDPEIVIRRVVEVLDDLGIEYVIGGSVASSMRGIPRLTNDIDIVADVGYPQVGSLVSRLQGDFYVEAAAMREAVESAGTFNLLHLPTMVKVDVFIRQSTPWAAEEWARRTLARVGGGPDAPLAYVASAEDMVLQKLDRFRLGGGISERQWGDVIGILRVQADDLDYAYLAEWAAQRGLVELLQRALADAGNATRTAGQGTPPDA